MSMGIIQPIFMRGDKLNCSNYSAITAYKILSGILCNRLTEHAEEILGEYQCVYHVNRSTNDHICTIR